jgi:hypothetical protein
VDKRRAIDGGWIVLPHLAEELAKTQALLDPLPPLIVPSDRPYWPSRAPVRPRVLVEVDPPAEHKAAVALEVNNRKDLYRALHRWENARDTLTVMDSRIRREREEAHQQVRARIDESCRRYLDVVDRLDISGLAADLAEELVEAGEEGHSLAGYHGWERRSLSFARSKSSWRNMSTLRDEGIARIATAGSEAEARRMIADRDEEWPLLSWPVKQETG